ncbi:MAG: radical SAM protein [Chloroflexi bacterium]|nr:radical SAM protein [Chloroflexota bacterium]
MQPDPFDEFFRHAPPTWGLEPIREAWCALGPRYDVNQWRLPLPPWVHRSYDYGGAQAWDMLRHDLALANDRQPFCIYLHVPFCSRKCGFCDSYSFKLGAHIPERIAGYVERLCYELQLWSAQGSLSRRPVSTVHLGGGTPTYLGEAALAQVIACCKACFATSPATEWALESTVEALTPGMIETMHALGFRRLHLGVQSLQDEVRTIIGRRRPAAEALERIAATLARGWIVSVDLVCGLPAQTLTGFVGDIEALIAAGVNGFSLYELLIYPQNRRWAERWGLTRRDHLTNYFTFMAGAQTLSAHGYTKNLFNHWADARDENIYFTFPTRQEDLLAVGTIADGVFGDFHYRHPPYTPYLKAACGGLPGLEGGLRRTAFESWLQPLRTRVLSGHFDARQVPALLDEWQAHGLITCDAGGAHLTNSGSWFAGNMVHELTELLRPVFAGQVYSG